VRALQDELERDALREQLASVRADLVASAQTAARFERERDELDAENLRLREQAGEMAEEIERLRLADGA
jgi:hypothetical protein